MLLLAGLGNPGHKYHNNRHNVGFMAIDEIHRRNHFSPWSKKFKAEIADGQLDGEKTILIKPQTYMNLSGQAIGEALRFYKVPLENLIVLYDELDLPAGKIRIKTGGGSGGHNGIKSIDAHCGKDYRRIRIGIGHPGAKELVHHYVLGNFAKADKDWLEPLLTALADNAALLTQGDDSKFMNKVTLALGGGDQRKSKEPKAQSHIKQARPSAKPDLPTSGPMADILKKIFGKE